MRENVWKLFIDIKKITVGRLSGQIFYYCANKTTRI